MFDVAIEPGRQHGRRTHLPRNACSQEDEVCVLRFNNEVGKRRPQEYRRDRGAVCVHQPEAIGERILGRSRTIEAGMNAVTIGISSVEETKQWMLRAFDGAEQGAFISFPTVEML